MNDKVVFLPRDAMRKSGLCCRPVSFRLSVKFVYCIHTAEAIIVQLLSHPGISNTLVFDPQAPVPISKGNQFSGGAKYTWWENFAIFD